MEVERCRALLCAVGKGTITAAAEELGYTPSAISRMIAALEEELGFPLLLRGYRGIQPSKEGKMILPALRELVFREEACRQLAAKIRGAETGSVVIGTAYHEYYIRLAKIVRDFHAVSPAVEIKICNGYSTELLHNLQNRALDLCIISRREGNHTWVPIRRDPMVCWLPAGHPLSQLPAVPISAFAEETCIETYPDLDIDNKRVYQRCRVKPNICFSTMDSHATYAMVEAGLGISMNNAINSAGREGTVQILPLDPPQDVEIGVASLSDRSLAAKRFLAFMLPRLQDAN